MANKKMLTIIVVVMAIMGFSMAVLGTGLSSQTSVTSQATSSASNNAGTQLVTNSHNVIGNINGSQSILKHNSNLNASISYDHGISRNDLFLPNPNVRGDYKIENSVVQPTYLSAPAPVGVSDIGVMNDSGTLKAYNLSTDSVEGTISVNNMSAFYPLDGEANNVTFQLNTVLKNVTVLGDSSLTYWTQNVVKYSTAEHTVCFENNIWNYSSTSAQVTANAINNSTGHVLCKSDVYVASGPMYTLTLPFTLNLYINTSIVNNMNAVWFNYSIPQLSVHGTYDRVLFNSSYGEASTFRTQPSYFFISGSTNTPSGDLYDAEFIIGGPGGGSNTNIMDINATMQLTYMNSTTHKMTSVPSAINFGMDTGETSYGVSTYWTSNDVVHLSQGPTLLEYMWGYSPAEDEGFMKITGSVSQSNAFIFFTNNLTNLPVWAPLSISGNFIYLVSPGDYLSGVLLNNYNLSTKYFSGTAGSVIAWNFILNKSTFENLYTPVYAFDNIQLKSDSIKGNGTILSPYVLPDVRGLFCLFGEMNDFQFPVFSTYEIVNTTSNSIIEQNSPLGVNGVCNNICTSHRIYLPIVIYGSSHITLSLEMVRIPDQRPNANGFFYSMLDIYHSSSVTLSSLYAFSARDPIFVSESSNIVILHSSIKYALSCIISTNSSLSIGSTCFYQSGVHSVGGYLNLTDVKMNHHSGLLSYSSHVKYFGNEILCSSMCLFDSTMTFTGVTINDTGLCFYNSSIMQSNTNVIHLHYWFMSFTSITVNDSSYNGLFLDMQNSTINMNKDVICCFYAYLMDSHGYVSSSQVNYSCLYVTNSSLSINQASTFTGGHIKLINSTTEILSSLLNYTSITVYHGHFNVVGSTFSNGVGKYWFIATNYSNTDYTNDTFLTADSFRHSYSQGSLIDTVEVIGGINSIENSLFYSSNSNVGSSLQFISGDNTVISNTFESKDISTYDNPNGGGSALITYGGTNQISGNSFITLSSGGQSLYIKDGDISTQTGNVYLYSVNFTESGLAHNSTWSLTVGGHTYTNSNNYINVLLSTGSYTYTATSNGYSGRTGTVKVDSSALVQDISFSALPKYSVTFKESGLPKLTNWTVTFDGHIYNTSAQSITITGVTMGTYAFSTGSFSKYYAPSSAYGNISVNSNMTQTIDFSGVMYAISFHESGLNSKTNWTAIVNGNTYFSNGLSNITLMVPIGTSLTYTIGNQTGYVSSVKNGNFPVSGNYTVAVQFVKSGISPTLTYIGIAIAAIVGIVVGAVSVVYVPKLLKRLNKKPTN